MIWFFSTIIMILVAFINATWILTDLPWVQGIVNVLCCGYLAYGLIQRHIELEKYEGLYDKMDDLEEGIKKILPKEYFDIRKRKN